MVDLIHAAKLALRALARRALELEAEIDEIDTQLDALVARGSNADE